MPLKRAAKAKTGRNRPPPSIPKLKKQAWRLLSELVRRSAIKESDSRWMGDVDCYTCGDIFHWKSIQAGHAIPGRTGAVLFDTDLIRPQCARCNIWMRGNYHIFTTKLIKENGMEWWERKLLESRQIRKWNRTDLQDLIEGYKVRLAELP